MAMVSKLLSLWCLIHLRVLNREYAEVSSHIVSGDRSQAHTIVLIVSGVLTQSPILPSSLLMWLCYYHPRIPGFRAIQITPRTDLPLLSFRLVRSGLFNTPSSWCRFIPSSSWELVTLGTTRNHLHEISRVNPGVLNSQPPCI